MGKFSRNKGCRGEREAAAKLRQLFGIPAYRGNQYFDARKESDVYLDMTRVHFEVKRGESFRLYESLEQAKQDAKAKGMIPVVLYRANRRPWVAIVELDNLPSLAAELHAAMLRNS